MNPRRKNPAILEITAVAQSWNDTVQKLVERRMRSWADRLAGRAAELAPDRRGRLRKSIRSEVKRDGNLIVAAYGTDLDYAKFVEFGTRPHIIRPKRASVLVFTDPFGITVHARQARHPGVKVGDPARPRANWITKTLTGKNPRATMPFLRAAWAQLKNDFVKDLANLGADIR